MFKLPNGIPSLNSSAQDWADYAEFLTLIKENGELSLLELIRQPSFISDEEFLIGIEDDSDRFLQKADEVIAEIRFRSELCGNKYPFITKNKDYTLSYTKENETFGEIYKYLLLCTRLQMNKNRVHGQIDGALLFEKLSAVVARSYFGDKSEVEVFGTSRSGEGGFRNKLEELIKRLNEGGSLHQNPGHRPQDENVDFIIWKGFSDRLPSQLIAFGQCKTGTSWVDSLSELNTLAFCNTWFTRQPVLTPIRLFFCAQYFPRDIWHVRAYEAGLVFDRFRILDWMPDKLDKDLYNSVLMWSKGAFASVKI